MWIRSSENKYVLLNGFSAPPIRGKSVRPLRPEQDGRLEQRLRFARFVSVFYAIDRQRTSAVAARKRTIRYTTHEI